MNEPAHRTFGVLVTYRRPDDLDRSLAAIASQSTRFEELVIVDNAPDERSRRIVDRYRERLGPVSIIDSPTNLGPAGGRSMGAREILARADDADWIVFLDDDDPLPTSDIVERLVAAAERLRIIDPASAGIGLRGARLERWTGRLMPVDGRGVVSVDHLHGDFVPCYAVGALRRVGTFDPRLFFGFEELELGLRLRRAGFTLAADGDLCGEVGANMGREPQRSRPGMRLEAPSLRRYYALRNLLVVLGREGLYLQAVGWALVAGILKPAVWLVVRPSLAWSHLRLNVTAIGDAVRGRLGPRTWNERAKVVER